MRVIIAGSRTVTEDQVNDALRRCPWINFISVVVSGTAKGADQFGERWASEQGIEVQRFPADWEALGKRAGPVRNKEMAENAEGLVVVWDGESRGTRSMIDLAKLKGLQVFCLLTQTGETVEYAPAGPVASLWEHAEERAAMMEVSGGVPRAEAERAAGRAAARMSDYRAPVAPRVTAVQEPAAEYTPVKRRASKKKRDVEG